MLDFSWNRLYAGFFLSCGMVMQFIPGTSMAAPFTNGSFESPGCSEPNFRKQIPNDVPAPTGWQASETGFQVYQQPIAGDLIARAADGQCYVSFGHSGKTGGFLYQTFDTETGATYEVDYYISQQQGSSLDQAVGVWVYDQTQLNGNNFINGTTNQFGNGPNVFTQGSKVEFVARSNQSTLVFEDKTPTGGGSGANWALDFVRVTKTKDAAEAATPTDPAIPRFVGQTSGPPEKRTLTGRLSFSSNDYGKSVKVWVLMLLPNGSLMSKVGDGNQWHFLGTFLEMGPNLPSLPPVTANSTTLVVPVLSESFLDKSTGIRVFMAYGTDYADMIAKNQFAEIHNTGW